MSPLSLLATFIAAPAALALLFTMFGEWALGVLVAALVFAMAREALAKAPKR